MKSLVKRCLESIYERTVNPEEAAMLKKVFQTEMKNERLMVVDGRMYRFKYFAEDGTERWSTHEKVGSYTIEIVRSWEGKISSRKFYRNDFLFREKDPAVQKFHMNGMPSIAQWYNEESGLARIPWEKGWDENGNKQHEVWRLDNGWLACGKRYLLHRRDGPAVMVWYPNGKIRRLEWWRHGYAHHTHRKFHSLDYHEDGTSVPPNKSYNELSIYLTLPNVDTVMGFHLISRPYDYLYY